MEKGKSQQQIDDGKLDDAWNEMVQMTSRQLINKQRRHLAANNKSPVLGKGHQSGTTRKNVKTEPKRSKHLKKSPSSQKDKKKKTTTTKKEQSPSAATKAASPKASKSDTKSNAKSDAKRQNKQTATTHQQSPKKSQSQSSDLRQRKKPVAPICHSNVVGFAAEGSIDNDTEMLVCPYPDTFGKLPVDGENVEESSDFVLLLRFISAITEGDEEILKLGSWMWSDIVDCVLDTKLDNKPSGNNTVNNHSNNESTTTHFVALTLQPPTKKRRVSAEPVQEEMVDDNAAGNAPDVNLVGGPDQGRDQETPDQEIPDQEATTTGQTMTPFCFTFLHRLLILCGKRLPIQSQRDETTYHHALERIIGKFLNSAPTERLCLFWDTNGENPFFSQPEVLNHWSDLKPSTVRFMRWLR